MITASSDIHCHLWNSTIGKILYRVDKRGIRTGQLYLYAGTTFDFKNKQHTVTAVDGNSVTTLLSSAVGSAIAAQKRATATFSFPLDLPKVSNIKLSDAGEMVHLENCICVDRCSIVAFTSGRLGCSQLLKKLGMAKLSLYKTNCHASTRGILMWATTSSLEQISLQLWSAFLLLLDTYNCVVDKDTRNQASKSPCVPMYYSNGKHIYSLFSLGNYLDVLEGWHRQDLSRDAIVAIVGHAASQKQWPIGPDLVDPLFSGRLSFTVRVNVTRDIFGIEDSSSNRCFDSLVRNQYGGMDGNTYETTSGCMYTGIIRLQSKTTEP